jgi:hypothetical protein
LQRHTSSSAACESRFSYRERCSKLAKPDLNVHHILMAKQIDEGSRTWVRNSLAVSQLGMLGTFLPLSRSRNRHTRCRNADQTYDAPSVLFDSRHIGVV